MALAALAALGALATALGARSAVTIAQLIEALALDQSRNSVARTMASGELLITQPTGCTGVGK